jgi:hypothetical protein
MPSYPIFFKGHPMHMKFVFFILLAVGISCGSTRDLFGQMPNSYLNENGDRVYTNIPPVSRANDLKINDSAPIQPSPTENPAPKSGRFDPIIEKYARHYQLDPSLIRSIIATESGFNPAAVSSKGARGLMQLMPSTAARLGVLNSFDPEQNIRGGVKHFRSLLDTFNNNLALSLAAYNAGENLVQRLGRVPEIKETREYVKSVTGRYGKKELSAQTQEEQRNPAIYRFVDESGVLHITNVPPLR